MSVYFQQSLLAVLLISGVPLIACACSGLIVSLLQTVTQIQEQTITYVVKIVTLIVVAILLSEFGVAYMLDYSTKIFESIGQIQV